MSNPYIYLFVREDLSKCQQIIQTAHAVDELNKSMDKFTDKTNHMVLCPADNEGDLFDISMYLSKQGVEHHIFFEPDIKGYTAIATVPLVDDERIPMRVFSTMK